MNSKRTIFDITRAKVRKERRIKLRVTGHVPGESSIRGRIAEFLNKCATNYPHSIILYEEITQAIFTLGRVPDQRSANVKSVRGQMSSAAKLLMTKYERSLVTCRGVGARASVDNSDVLRESLTKDAERHRQTGEKLKRTAELIDPVILEKELKGLKGDPTLKQEMIELSAWLKESMSKYIKTLGKPQSERALLPPPVQE